MGGWSTDGERRVQQWLYGTGLAMAGVFLLGPVAIMILTSISSDNAFMRHGLVPTLQNYRAILGTPSLHFGRYCLNSLVVGLISAACATLVASGGAYMLTRFPFRGRGALLLGTLALSMFPQICIAGYLFRIIASAGLVNTWAGLLLPYVAWILPLSFWILVSYFAQIPRELDKAAFIDGCSPPRTLLTVILPLAAPGMFATFLLAFISAFNEFMFALMLTSDHTARTVPVGIALFQGLHGEIPWGTVTAASVLTSVPVIIITLSFQRHIIQGLTRGAVKG